MNTTGYIRIYVYTGRARIPLKNVAISITSTDGTAIAVRATNRSGQTEPVAIPVNDITAGLTADTGILPYTQVNVYARLEGYEQQENTNVQIFPNTVTMLDMELIPASEWPGSYKRINKFETPPQNL